MIERFALIIGAMKSGTTTIANSLGRHPEIALSRPKEPGYFAFDDIHERGAGWYEGLFRFDPAVHKVALEGSTDYTKLPECPDSADRIRRFGRDMRLIYIMRHPLRRIESHARHVQRTRMEVGRIVSDRPDHGLDAGVSPVSLAVSRYASQIEAYQDFYEAGRLKLLTLEALEASPEKTMRDLCAYLDVDPDLLPPEVSKSNAGESRVKAKDAGAVWKTATSLGPVTELMKKILPKDVRQDLREKLWPKKSITGRFRLTEDEEGPLLEALAPDLRKLRQNYGIDPQKEWGISV